MDVHRANLLNYCMSYVEDMYLKIIRIDFKDGSFEVFKVKDGIDIPDVKTIEEWVDCDLKSDTIHPEDIPKFKNFANLEEMRRRISETDKGFYCSYRRKNTNGDYIHISMCLIKDKEHYDQDHEYGILYVKDINSIYETEYECILEDLGTKDSFTNLLNRFAYERDVSKYKGGNVGVIYTDLNGLKFVNDTYGHSEGDKLIKHFANLLKRAFSDYRIYHISGDEFIVISYDANLRSFLQRVVGWHRWLWEQKHPIASVGYSLDANITDIKELVTESENAMYVDKDFFYTRFPQFKRA